MENTLELERILNEDHPGAVGKNVRDIAETDFRFSINDENISQVHSLIRGGISPEYERGELVSKVAMAYGINTLEWYTKETSADFMNSRQRAWNLVQAMLYRYRVSKSSAGISRVYNEDTRKNKSQSIAYLRGIREALQEDSLFSPGLIKLMEKNFPAVLFQALSDDFTDSKQLPSKDGYDSLLESSYVQTLSQMAGLSKKVLEKVEVFSGAQVMLAESKDDKTLLAANLLLGGWTFLIDYDKYSEEVLWAARASLATAKEFTGQVVLLYSEAIMKFRNPKNFDDMMTILKRAVADKGMVMNYSADVNDTWIQVGRKLGAKFQGFTHPSEAELDGKRGLAAIYVKWREKGLHTASDIDEMTAEIKTYKENSYDKEYFLESMEKLYGDYED